MATPVKKATYAAKATGASNGGRGFPPEAYTFDDDVTPEAVDSVRQRAREAISAEDWEVVDGFELSDAY